MSRVFNAFMDELSEKSGCDYHYGWLPDTIRKAQILRTRYGWFIEFPKSLPID